MLQVPGVTDRLGPAVYRVPGRRRPIDRLEDVHLARRRPPLAHIIAERGPEQPERRPDAHLPRRQQDSRLDVHALARRARKVVGLAHLDARRRPLAGAHLQRRDLEGAGRRDDDVGRRGRVRLDLVGAPVPWPSQKCQMSREGRLPGAWAPKSSAKMTRLKPGGIRVLGLGPRGQTSTRTALLTKCKRIETVLCSNQIISKPIYRTRVSMPNCFKNVEIEIMFTKLQNSNFHPICHCHPIVDNHDPHHISFLPLFIR
ncbi:hypothetical protein B0T25DRAFT_255635 [Lasiosphaeria hispida]|uniref:Uncharacterized protein n=1 Tax=Lasiosphaeria hispida TaxID=260671 RepID=A0AAJ0HG65_9PEZI|nr:hypothetical protein B0T25DRAFT_255635 [Lasiosphaeria hispida]